MARPYLGSVRHFPPTPLLARLRDDLLSDDVTHVLHSTALLLVVVVEVVFIDIVAAEV